MTRILLFLGLVLGGFVGFSQTPLTHADYDWEYLGSFSDEFNSDALNTNKWNTDVKDWGTWSWEPENALVRDTVLVLKMEQKEHRRNNKDFYFTSGIARSKEEMTYGYFETRIKASAKGQGTCPAFWLYSVGQPTPTEENGVQYCEIDAIEIFQIANKTKRLEMNLHTRIIENGELTWKRPGQGDTELCHNSWDAPWDPRDKYHTYGVLNRPDSIFWYVDGVERGAKKNYYWHLPMYITVSMGLRTPYEKYINGVRTSMPFPESEPEEGFPAEMYCDYVRVWEALPQIKANTIEYSNKQFVTSEPIPFTCYFDAGSSHKVISGDSDGLEVRLVEKDKLGNVTVRSSIVEHSIVGKQVGWVSLDLPVQGLTLSKDLPEGHSYGIEASLTSSKDENTEVQLSTPMENIQLVDVISGKNKKQLSNVSIVPNPCFDVFHVQGVGGSNAMLSIFDSNGSKVKYVNSLDNNRRVGIHDLSQGVYLVKIEAPKGEYITKFIKQDK